MSEVETPEMIRRRKIKRAIRAAIIGTILALICHALPAEYQSPCKTIIRACSGNF